MVIAPSRFPVQLPRLRPEPQGKKRKQQPRDLERQQSCGMRKRLPQRCAEPARPARQPPAPFGHRRRTRHCRPRSRRPDLPRNCGRSRTSSGPSRWRTLRGRTSRRSRSPGPFHGCRSAGGPVAQLAGYDACPDAKNPADPVGLHGCSLTTPDSKLDVLAPRNCVMHPDRKGSQIRIAPCEHQTIR